MWHGFLGCIAGKNLIRELVDITSWLVETREEGVEHKGNHYVIEWFQSMDLSSFWKQALIDQAALQPGATGEFKHLCYNALAGFCLYCPCNNREMGLFHRWASYVLGTATHYHPILPIDQWHTVYCLLHAKIRITEKLLTLAACSAKAAGATKLQAFQDAVRQVMYY